MVALVSCKKKKLLLNALSYASMSDIGSDLSVSLHIS